MSEENEVKPGEFVIEPPTLVSLGFEWHIEGDDNHNATVEVWYREKGESAWRKALPLLRIQNEESIAKFLNNSIDYVTPNLFAGSILNLKPDTEYECRFLMLDPDGVIGSSEKTVAVRTRMLPHLVFSPAMLSWFMPAFTKMIGLFMGVISGDRAWGLLSREHII